MSALSNRPRIIVDHKRARPSLWTVLLGLLAALTVSALTTWLLLRADLRGQDDAQQLRQQLSVSQAMVEQMRQQAAIQQRGAQVLEQSNDELRDELSRVQQDIAALRADLAFYQRLLDQGGTRAGLAVHELRLQATPSAHVYRFKLTLSQNLKKAKVVEGAIGLAVEGLSADRPQTLSGNGLGLSEADAPLRFSFKYFQQIDGTLVLPENFTPHRITVVLEPNARGATPASHSFEWLEVAPPSQTAVAS